MFCFINGQITSFFQENGHNSAQNDRNSIIKSLTNIWPSFGNINLISKVCKIELEGEKKFKTSKNRSIFCIKKIKIAFSQKVHDTGQVWWEGCTGGVTQK